MARVGWVSAAEVGTEDWYRLTVFDDGWVDLPGFGRSLSDTRRNLRTSLGMLAVLFGVLGGALLLGRFTALLDGIAATVSRVVTVILVVAGLVYVTVMIFRMRSRDHRQLSDDAAQARRMRAEGRLLERAPGTSWFGRVRSAQEMADALINARLTRAADVAAVTITEKRRIQNPTPNEYSVCVEFTDGTARTYTTPDKMIVGLLGRFGDRNR